ncbi:MAG: toll/interleukin-1 receptor domain-containing protein, partial [Saprospiraceae bacterium]|nr:toll/interleukin-1 receptor domain-containing protein [Saprospiraceae bacterium]
MTPAEHIHIFISFNTADVHTAEGLYHQLNQALEGRPLIFWNPNVVAPEDFRKTALVFLEKTDLFVACLSNNYLDHPDERYVLEGALTEQKRRPDLQLLVVVARAAFIPASLQGFPVAPAADQPVEGYSLGRDVQLKRSAQRARDLLFQVDRSRALFPAPEGPEFELTFEDVRERLIVRLEHCDLAPLFQFLKQLLHPERTPDALFQLEDAFAEWRQQSQRNKLGFDVFSQTVAAIRLDLRHLIEQLEVRQFRSTWPRIFAANYYGWAPVNAPADALAGLFLPFGAVHVPKTLHLPDHSRQPSELAAESALGSLSVQQQQRFRRDLLLAQDAIGIGQFGRAYAYCEQVREQIDPQSAQLYELLLLSYLKKEGPDRIIHDAVYGKGQKLNHVVVYAGRFADYQRAGICPSEAGMYNLAATAQALSDALLRLYSTYQNDYILHTGRY